MRITQLETITVAEFPTVTFVQLHTDEGLVGLGETAFGAPEVVEYLHEAVAPRLLGHDAASIEAIRVALRGVRLTGLGTGGSGVEMRAASAVDIALWDLLGKATNRPIYELLGGASRTAVPVYNTCAGYAIPGQTVDALDRSFPAAIRGPFDDLAGWQEHDAGELAASLLAQGVTAMKMWPFDAYAQATGGRRISDADLDHGLDPYRQVRNAVGGRMDLLVELHGLWNLPTALKIARAFEREALQPLWIEDPLLPDDLANLARFAAGTSIPTAASELLGGRLAFRELLEARAASVVILEMCWCGGISEGKAIATLADAFGLPIAPHDGTGPVGWAAGVQLAINAPNTLIQESVRAFYTGWYTDLVTQLPSVENGVVTAPSGPGLGVGLRPETRNRPDAQVRTSSLGGAISQASGGYARP